MENIKHEPFQWEGGEDCCCINNTGNEVIEPLAHRNDGKGILSACQDPLPLGPSECFIGTGGGTDAFKGDWRDSEGYRRYLLSEGGGIMPYSKRIRFQYAKYVREQLLRMINFRFR